MYVCGECLFLMRSERASRVCIVVLEEVEEDEPSSSSPPPQPKSSPEPRSHHPPQKASVQDDKVRLLLSSLLFKLQFAEFSFAFDGGYQLMQYYLRCIYSFMRK